MAELGSGANLTSPAVSSVMPTAHATRSVEPIQPRKRQKKRERGRGHGPRLLEASAPIEPGNPSDEKSGKGCTIDLRV